MKNLNENVKGFSAIGLVLIVIIVALIVVVGWLVYKNHHKTSGPTNIGAMSQQGISDGSVSVNLKLDKYRATIGSPISGVANIVDQKASPLKTEYCSGETPYVGLQNSKFKYVPIVATQACDPTRELSPGNNYFSIQIDTSACNYGVAQFECGSTYSSNLPTGTYEVVIWLNGIQDIKNNSLIIPPNVTLIPN